MSFGLEHGRESLVTPMALVHALHSVRSRTRNKRQNGGLDDVFFLDDLSSGPEAKFISTYICRLMDAYQLLEISFFWRIYTHLSLVLPLLSLVLPLLDVNLATVYPKKYAHGFVVLCFVVVMQSFIMNSHEVFIHIHQGCFAGTGAIVRLPQCQWSKPDGYGKISQCITTTKHSKAKTVCIFLGIYCSMSA